MENKFKELLEVGQVYKSYRQVCEVLGENVKNGNSKSAQIKEWERHFSYSKDGNKFVIEEIYDVPKEKVDNRGGNNSHITNLLSLILVNTLYNEENNSLKLTLGKLYKKFNMINDNFNTYKDKNGMLSKYLNIDIDIVKEFYSLNHNNFKRTIENVLNKLQNERIIIYDKVTYIKPVDEKQHRPADESEKVTIMYIEKLLLNKYDYESYPDIYYSNDYKDFMYDSKKLMKEFNISYYYFVYDITINKLFIGDKLKELILTNDMFFDKKKELNDSLIDRINTNAMNRQITSMAVNSKNETYTDYLRTREDYLDDYKNLIKTLIDDESKTITKDEMDNKLKEIKELKELEKANSNTDEVDLFDLL